VARILLLDDEHTVLTLLQGLVARGHPDWALTWVETLPELEAHVASAPPYDLALIDLYLPLTPWTETLATALRLFAAIPVVVLTGASEMRSQVMALGKFGFLNKDELVKAPDTVAAYLTSALETGTTPPAPPAEGL
jgi:DNA-binding NtrC family response regulator